MSRSDAKVSVNVGFPVFDLGYLPYTREILVAGGGGASRSGVLNGISVFQLTTHGHLHKTHHFSTGTGAVMTLQASKLVDNDFIVGINNECILYERHKERLGKKKSVLIDISGPDGYIKCLSQQGNLLALGTTDGRVHLFRFPNLGCLKVLECDAEVVGIGATKQNELVVLSKKTISLHNLDASFDKLAEKSVADGLHFRCILTLSDGTFLVALNAPQKGSSMLVRYSREFRELKKLKCLAQPITAIAVSVDEQVACFGTSGGSLGIVDVRRFSLTSLHRNLFDFAITSVAMDHLGKYAFACSANGKLFMIRTARSQRLLETVKTISIPLLIGLFVFWKRALFYNQKLAALTYVMTAAVGFINRHAMLAIIAVESLLFYCTKRLTAVDSILLFSFTLLILLLISKK